MQQKIFQMDFSTETVSLYLLCCGLEDAGTTLSVKNLLEVWNATPDIMQTSFQELEDRGVVKKILSDGKSSHIYKLNPVEAWR